MAGNPRKRARLAALAGVTIEAVTRIPKFERQVERELKKPRRTGYSNNGRNKGLNVGADGKALRGNRDVVAALPAVVDDMSAVIAYAARDDQSETFKQLLAESLKFAVEIMQMKMPETWEKEFAKVLGVKQQIASSVLTATVRVNDGSLRGQGGDKFTDLLAAVKAEAKKLQTNGSGTHLRKEGAAPSSPAFDEASLF